ncbi:MAG: hypothetical protein HOC71_09050 [Candidatus Latescibacteria bacterium]|jgi:hypothetical protein|nr:hypothetical protein [Candidatus Latescibacterota bacterium]
MFITNKKLQKLLLIILFQICSLSVHAESDLETIITGADLGDNLVTSGRGNLIFEYVRVDSLSLKARSNDEEHLLSLSEGVETVFHNREYIKLNFAFDNVKIKCEEISAKILPSGRLYDTNWQWAYNGEKLDLLRLDGLGEGGLIKPYGSVRTENIIPVRRFNPGYNGLYIFGTPVGTFLRGSLDGKEVKDIQVIGEEMQDDILCDIIRGYVSETGDTITIWLAPGLMYRPKHIEMTSSIEKTVVHNTFKEYPGSIWFPAHIIKEEYYYDDETGKETLHKQETLTVQDGYKLNIKLPDALFEVKFPLGMMVYDYRTGERKEIK